MLITSILLPYYYHPVTHVTHVTLNAEFALSALDGLLFPSYCWTGDGKGLAKSLKQLRWFKYLDLTTNFF